MNPTELLGLLARTLAATDDERHLAHRLVQACVEILDGQGGTLTVAAVPGDRLVVSTSEQFERIEAMQEVLGEGPVHQALLDDRLVVARVLDLPNPFPVFAQQAALAVEGPLTVYAVPMHAGTRTVGVFSLYVTRAGHVRADDDLQFLADTVGTSLIGDLESLDWSLKARVHQATGMVAAQLRVTPDDALSVLRAQAFSRGVDLQKVAEDVLARRTTFAEDGTTTQHDDEGPEAP